MKLTKKQMIVVRKYRDSLVKVLIGASKGRSPKNEDLSTTWIGDIADHIHLCNDLLSNRIKPDKLQDTLWELDTQSRDCFPQEIWDIIPNDESEDCE